MAGEIVVGMLGNARIGDLHGAAEVVELRGHHLRVRLWPGHFSRLMGEPALRFDNVPRSKFTPLETKHQPEEVRSALAKATGEGK